MRPDFKPCSICVTALCVLLVLAAVLQRAWISDDALITLRYVNNTLAGYGAVFNVGERVQGYSHPLWFLLLLPCTMLFRDPVLAAILLGLLLTAGTVGLAARGLFRAAQTPLAAAGLLVLACLAWVSSDPWLSFQTGGLENALSHLLIAAVVVECFLHGTDRPGRLALALALLCLVRPDFIFFCAPLGILVLMRTRSLRSALALLPATAVCAAWVGFAWAYYGNPVPNTGYAKLGIYATWLRAAGRGVVYIADWSIFDPVAAGGAVLLLLCAFAVRGRPAVIACLLGVLAHVLWVVWVGGDFMRGRLLLPAFMAAVLLGSMALAEEWRSVASTRLAKTAIVGLALAALFVGSRARGTPAGVAEWHGILNERKYYPGYSLASYLREGRLASPDVDLGLADELRTYATACGPITIHARHPAGLAYRAGPDVSVIDTLGLTDAFIARLPRRFLSDPDPRPGHPDKYIPVSYLASRGDLALAPDWLDAIRARDCTLRSRVDSYRESPAFLAPFGGLVER